MRESKKWWEKPLRVIQPNLQVRDTSSIRPAELAQQMECLHANAVVFNVGGIYAWYDTKIEYHYKNAFLPREYDLLEKVISECHSRGIKFIARFDFSKASDYIYQKRPEWFARDPDGEPKIIGGKRFGEWNLLLSTCTNGLYRTDAVAIPVLNEVMSNYEIDGIFYNAPGYVPCWCEACRRKYRLVYGKELPEKAELFEKTWPEVNVHDNISRLYSFIKSKNHEVPMILYYSITGDHIMFNRSISDMFCTESQDVLSLGVKEQPPVWKPAMTMKIGKAFAKNTPFGIIHSSPGMDWRHTGLPAAEYRPWMSQIPANGGSIWHSITGVPDTITDKRIMKAIGELNAMVEKVENYMDGASLKARTALLWNGTPAAEALADGLLNKQIQFGVILPEQADVDSMKDFSLVIIPESWKLTPEFIADLRSFAKQGGRLLFEGTPSAENPELCELLGITEEVCLSEKLTASYLRFEGTGNPLQVGMEETDLIPYRGKVLYCHPKQGAKVFATLVPPFSPLDGVGAPPERASLPVSHTDIPLCIFNLYGSGASLFMTFSLSGLIGEYKLEEHYRLLANAVGFLLGDENVLTVTPSYQGLQVSVFEKGTSLLINLVNESGSRPLQQNIPLYNIGLAFRLSNGKKITNVRCLISGDNLEFAEEAGRCKIVIPELPVWECLLIETVSS